jgi:hypothetical protein
VDPRDNPASRCEGKDEDEASLEALHQLVNSAHGLDLDRDVRELRKLVNDAKRRCVGDRFQRGRR